MKTVIEFRESIDMQEVTIYHHRDIKITREQRKSHLFCTDGLGNPILVQDYIVVRIPNFLMGGFPVDNIQMKWDRAVTTGFHVVKHEDFVELLLFDRITFVWELLPFNKMGIFRKVIQRRIPDKEYHDLFKIYINATNVRQFSYNVVAITIEWIYKSWKEKRWISYWECL